MNHWKKPLLVNGIILAVIFLFSFLFVSTGSRLPERFGFTSLFMVLLAPLNLVIGMVRNRNKKPDGMQFIIMAGLLLLVGFSFCTGLLFYQNE